MVNSYANDDTIMTAAFTAFYGRPMRRSLLYGEGFKSQRLEMSPSGVVRENHLSRGSVDGLIPMPENSRWDQLPPDVNKKYFDFLFSKADEAGQ